MLIFYGTGEKRIKPNLLRQPNCPNCDKPSIHFFLFFKYPHIFWIPLFPIGKRSVAVCEECSIVYEQNSMPESLKFELDDVRSSTKTPPYLFAGLALLIVGIIALINISNGPKTYKYPSGQKQAEGKMIGDKMEGEWTFWYENGNVSTIQYYKNGREDSIWTWWTEEGNINKSGGYKQGMYHGSWSFYYPNGQAYAVEMFKNNRRNGPAKYYYENGSKSAEGEYKRDKKDGIWTYWYENGQVSEEGKYDKDENDGEWLAYYESGGVSLRSNYVDGEIQVLDFWDESGNSLVKNGDGKYSTFFSNGNISSTGAVKNGKFVGRWKSFDSVGNVLEIGNYKGGDYFLEQAWDKDRNKLISNGNGLYKNYYDNGVVASQGEYENGLQNGPWVFRNENDVVIQKIIFEDGKGNGISSYFFETGELYAQGNLIDNERDGLWKWYFSHGEKECEVDYKNGKKEGIQVFWNESGIKVKQEFYEAGKLIKEQIFK